MSPEIAKWVIAAGILIAVIGVVGYYFGGVFSWFGRLPGDIRVEKENFSFYFPLTSMILISLLLSLIIRWLR